MNLQWTHGIRSTIGKQVNDIASPGTVYCLSYALLFTLPNGISLVVEPDIIAAIKKKARQIYVQSKDTGYNPIPVPPPHQFIVSVWL